MGKRLCAPSPRLGLTRRGLSLRLRSNGAWAAASSPHQAPGRRLAPPRSSVRRLGTPGHAPAAGSDREVVLPSTPLCRLTGTRGDGRGASRNVRPRLQTISLPAECKAWAARWPLDRLSHSMNSRLGRWKTRKTDDPAAIGPSYRDGIGQASPEPENRTVGGVARGGGMDRPPPNPDLLFRSYRWARSSSRRLVNGSAFSAKSRARCAKPL